jgi:hypothetical protein
LEAASMGEANMRISEELYTTIEGLVRFFEAAGDREREKKRRRHVALALGLIGQGPQAAKAIASILPKSGPRKLRRRIDVAAFQTIGPRGTLKDPVPIAAGDTLYISPVGEPGTGIVSRDPSRIPYAVAGEAIAAGIRKAITVTLYEKLWLTDGKPCEICEENSIAGWIPIDKTFPSGDWEPKAHPNCKCSLEVRPVV